MSKTLAMLAIQRPKEFKRILRGALDNALQGRPLHCVIRNNRECYVTDEGITGDERLDIAERKRSPDARRKFGHKLRIARLEEDRILLAQLRREAEARKKGE